MVDFRIHDGASEHRKMRAAGPAALGLWAMAGSYCMRPDVLSDGWVPLHYVQSWPSGKRLAGVLVKVGLWSEEVRDGLAGYRFHDWLDIQRSAAGVQSERESARARMARLRAEGSKDVRANKPRTQSEGSSEVPPMFNDSLSLSLSLSPRGQVGGGVPDSTAGATSPRPPERCSKHRTAPTSEPCRDCGDARRAAATWDTADAERATHIRRDIDAAIADPRQRCEHGADGGKFTHPITGQSATCAHCRHTQAREAS